VTEARRRVNLPVRPFLYTLDQVATILNLSEITLKRDYLHFTGRTPGLQDKDRILAINIAAFDKPAEFRVEEREFVRWLKRKGFRVVG
jgi:hypothetical protein